MLAWSGMGISSVTDFCTCVCFCFEKVKIRLDKINAVDVRKIDKISPYPRKPARINTGARANINGSTGENIFKKHKGEAICSKTLFCNFMNLRSSLSSLFRQKEFTKKIICTSIYWHCKICKLTRLMGDRLIDRWMEQSWFLWGEIWGMKLYMI